MADEKRPAFAAALARFSRAYWPNNQSFVAVKGVLSRPIANIFAGNANNRGGIRVAANDLDGDAKIDLVVGDGAGAGSRVTAYAGITHDAGGTTPLESFDAFPGSNAAVFDG